MRKWRLMISCLPIVFIVLAAKLSLTEIIHFKGLMELSEMGVILTGGIFLMGFMLSGTMADYKESEKIPADLACTCEAIEETFELCFHPEDKELEREVKNSLMLLFKDIGEWMTVKTERKNIFEKLNRFRKTMVAIESVLPSAAYYKIINELQNLRKIISRVNVISMTGFILTGYALLEMIMVLIGLLLMITAFKNIIAEIVIVFFISLIYLYMYRLIRDIDDPFEYKTGRINATEIKLFPLKDFFARANERLSK